MLKGLGFLNDFSNGPQASQTTLGSRNGPSLELSNHTQKYEVNKEPGMENNELGSGLENRLSIQQIGWANPRPGESDKAKIGLYGFMWKTLD